MKRVVIADIAFATLIDGVKNSLNNDMYRPDLSYIKLVVKKDEITAYSCDGYSAAKVTVPNLNPTDEEFECLIKPITVKPSKGRPQDIIVEVVDDDTYVEVPVEYGKLRYCFTQPKDIFLNIEKIIESTDKNDTYTIHVQPALLIKALKAAQKTSKFAKVQFGDKLSPFIIKAKCAETNNWQVVLPARGEEE
nr:MAG TPA: DNA polymerase III beta subunit, central domain [Caudoviricetes sp.]